MPHYNNNKDFTKIVLKLSDDKVLNYYLFYGEESRKR